MHDGVQVDHAERFTSGVVEQDVADLCASFQEAVADVVSDRTARAIALYEDRLGPGAQLALVVAGGVAAYDPGTLHALPRPDEVDLPQCLALDPQGNLWAAERSGRILQLDRDGSLQTELEGFGPVSSLAVEPETGTLWLAQSARNRILRVHPDSADVTTALPLFQPFRVAIGILSQER